MDNWFLREAGSKSSTPFHHDISYFDMDGTMCVLWLPLQPTKKNEGVVWVRGSHLWNKFFLRVLFRWTMNVYFIIPPDILGNKDYEFLQWEIAVTMRTLGICYS